METTDDAMQPRAQLNMLPDELKTYIARLCADQDVALREALVDAEKRFAGCYPQCTDIYGYRLKVQSSLGVLYQTSKEWQKITAPYRFRHLNYRQLCAERFLFDYAHRVGRFVVLLDLTTAATINGFVHLAGAVSLLPNLKQIKVDNYEQVFKTARDPGPYPHSHSTYVIDSAEAAVGRLLNAATDVSITVADLDQVSQRLSLDARGRLQRLSVQVTTEAFGRLIPLLRTTPRLQFFELRLTGNNADLTEVVLDALLDNHKRADKGATVLPALRALKLEYPDISRTVLAFAELFAPTLESLELHIRDYDEDFEVAKLEEPIGFVKEFPALTDLTLTGDIEALCGPGSSLSDELFPALKHLHYLPYEIISGTGRRPGEPELASCVRKKPIARISTYNLLGPVKQNKFTANFPTSSRVTEPPLYPSLLGHSAAPHASKTAYRKRDLARTLQFLRDWEARAEAQGDTASLLRMASALTRVELERIAHEA